MAERIKKLLLLHEPPLWLAWLTVIFLFKFNLADQWLSNLSHPVRFGLLFAWLFIIVIWNSLDIAHHVEALSELIYEPFGTLILTLSVTSIEMVTIISVMLIGDQNQTLVRDTMYAILMIALNGIVGLSLLLGGIRYREQRYNLRGSLEFISVIMVLAVISLVLPDFTQSTADPTFSRGQSVFLVLTSLVIYTIFLGMQTLIHTQHFILPSKTAPLNSPMKIHVRYSPKPPIYHGLLLIAYLIPTLFIAKQIAVPIKSTLIHLNPPAALGGLFVAILVLAPEGISAIRASWKNHLQRSVNITLGAVLSTTALTVPVVLLVSLFTGQQVILGLDKANITLLLLSLITAIVTFGGGRTNILQGALHLLLFFAYIMLIFDSKL